MTPTQRSLAALRELGYLVEVVEKWNSFTRTRKDLMSFSPSPSRSPPRCQRTGAATTRSLRTTPVTAAAPWPTTTATWAASRSACATTAPTDRCHGPTTMRPAWPAPVATAGRRMTRPATKATPAPTAAATRTVRPSTRVPSAVKARAGVRAVTPTPPAAPLRGLLHRSLVCCWPSLVAGERRPWGAEDASQ